MHQKKKSDEVANVHRLSGHLFHNGRVVVWPKDASEGEIVEIVLGDSSLDQRKKEVRRMFEMSDMGKVILVLLILSAGLMIWIFNDSWFGL